MYKGLDIIKFSIVQVYKGLDIITNKVTPEEQAMVPHHLLDFVDPLKNYNVQQFQKDATNIIKDLHSRDKLPVVVGGTNYYIESLLWDVLIIDDKIQLDSFPRDKISDELKVGWFF